MAVWLGSSRHCFSAGPLIRSECRRRTSSHRRSFWRRFLLGSGWIGMRGRGLSWRQKRSAIRERRRRILKRRVRHQDPKPGSNTKSVNAYVACFVLLLCVRGLVALNCFSADCWIHQPLLCAPLRCPFGAPSLNEIAALFEDEVSRRGFEIPVDYRQRGQVEGGVCNHQHPDPASDREDGSKDEPGDGGLFGSR